MSDSDDLSSGIESESEYEDDYECCCSAGNGALPFDPTAIQNIILKLSDLFDIRVILSDSRTHAAMVVTGGLALAGSMLGKHYGGNMGAMLGGAVGGACGLGIAVVSLREVWEDVKSRLWELFEITYDYLAGMGLQNYKMADDQLTRGGSQGPGAHLAQILAEVASKLLKKKITTSISF